MIENPASGNITFESTGRELPISDWSFGLWHDGSPFVLNGSDEGVDFPAISSAEREELARYMSDRWLAFGAMDENEALALHDEQEAIVEDER